MLDHARTRIGAVLVFFGAFSTAAYAKVSGTDGVSAARKAGTPQLSKTLYKELKTKFLTTSQIDHKFLKISQLQAKVTKLLSLGVFDNNLAQQLKIDSFLKIDAANAEFLKIGGVAANASKLGGLAPSDFLQGHGNVMSGEANNVTSVLIALVPAPGIAHVSVNTNGAGQPQITLVNDSAMTLNGAAEVNGRPSAISIGANQSLNFAVPAPTSARFQITDGSAHAVTFDVDAFMTGGQTPALNFTGQALVGLL